MRNKLTRKGHTLAEVLIVVAIIAVLVGVAAVSVFAYLRSMTKLEYDGYAKEIFIAAQNHLTASESQGYLTRTDFGDVEPAIAGINDTGDGVYYFVITDDYTDVLEDTSVLNLMLPTGAVDETVRLGGSYIVRYHKDSAKVLDVFYWKESGTRFAHEYTSSDYPEFLSKRGDRDALRTYGSDKSVIGWYGGAEAAGLSHGEDPRAPEIVVTNAEKLTVTVTDKNKNADSSKNVKNARLKLIITGVTSGNSREIALDLTQISEFFNASDISNDSDGWTVYNIVLDDISTPGKHFSELFCSDPIRPLIPGEDVTIQAVAFNNDELTDIAYSSKQTTNSLFAYNNSGDGAAHVSYMRHLENLDEDISALAYDDTRLDYINNTLSGRRVTAFQTTDLSWSSFPGEYIYSSSLGSMNGSKLTATAHTYQPVTPDYPLTYGGKGHTVSNIVADTSSYAEGREKTAGLFGELDNAEIYDLRLLDFNITGTNAGALAGSIKGDTSVSNVIAVNGTNAATTTVTGTGSVGGLVGACDDSEITASAAALVVSSTGGDAGGLAGKTTGASAVTSCHSGGHTVEGRYTTAYNVTAAANAGGLIGDAGDSVIRYSYSTCSASGASAGGLTASANGGTISACYATGLVNGTTVGAFAASLTQETVSNCRYYEIINEIAVPTGGYRYLTALASGDNANITALDADADAFNDYIGDERDGASPYDASLIRYYGGDYGLLTSAQLGGTLAPGDFVSIHYGDWPSPELWIINTGHSQGGNGGSGSGSEGGSENTPVLHGTADMSNEKFVRGAVIQDDTGTCVIMSGMWGTWSAYSGGATVAQLVAQYGNDAVSVDATDIKDSTFTGELKSGDLYYDSDSDTYYYVTSVSLYESRPNSAWIPLLP